MADAPGFRPATPYEIGDLTPFNGSYELIERVLGDRLDIAYGWQIVATQAHGSSQRVYVVNPASASGLAYAYIEGDGSHFGRVGSPTEQELYAFISGSGSTAADP